MELTLKRIALRDTYTIGKLYVNGVYFCDTLEDKVRDIEKTGKVYAETAIPYGRYNLTMNVRSPKYSDFKRYAYAQRFSGYMPRLLNVPHFDGVLIHPGNTDKDSAGCILVGRNTAVGKLTDSVATWTRLMDAHLWYARSRRETITIEIV